MIKFDLERAKNDDKVTTRDGRHVRLFYFDLANKRGHKILGVIVEPSGMETIVTWAPDGAYCKERYASANDLVMAPKMVTKHYNVYKGFLGGLHDTLEAAEREIASVEGGEMWKNEKLMAGKTTSRLSVCARVRDYIETRKVTWEE